MTMFGARGKDDGVVCKEDFQFLNWGEVTI